MSTSTPKATTEFAVNRTIDAIKQAEFELRFVDLRTVPAAHRQTIKDTRATLTKTRNRLTQVVGR